MISLRIALPLLAALACVSAYDIHFQNDCSYTVWAAVGKAPNGVPDDSVAFGNEIGPGGSADFGVDDSETGIRAWGRTGCDSTGANCQTGACNGGLVCTDAGITAAALFSEIGLGTDGNEYWDLSYVGGSINIPARFTGPDGQQVYCAVGDCPDTQAFSESDDYGALRNSPQGGTYTHAFCG
ncbi:hypothetical protein CBS101457_002945 [Exobasidium rhododendri]|nr:hypothetical protein CBS101457_002945 [Exobasidium rhododendri]